MTSSAPSNGKPVDGSADAAASTSYMVTENETHWPTIPLNGTVFTVNGTAATAATAAAAAAAAAAVATDFGVEAPRNLNGGGRGLSAENPRSNRLLFRSAAAAPALAHSVLPPHPAPLPPSPPVPDGGEVYQNGVLIGSLGRWVNPHSNGAPPLPAPACSTIQMGHAAGWQGTTFCREPWCGATTRAVAAQMFNVLTIPAAALRGGGGGPDGGDYHLYYGERWQSTFDGLKAHDFSYMSVLQFDDAGVVAPLKFEDEFQLAL